MKGTALIAEDEPLLAARLARELLNAWPELEVLATVGDGEAAFEQAIRLRPDILFLDVQMPKRTGLEVARRLAEQWDAASRLPLFVFVTAHERFAVAAFESAAVDFLLKPIQRDRLEKTCKRLKEALEARRAISSSSPPSSDSEFLRKLRRLLESDRQVKAARSPMPRLERIQASEGSVLHIVPVEEVLCFEAADKYVRVITAQREHLVRTTLTEIANRLDPGEFWQVRRGTVVRASAIVMAERQESGNFLLTVRGLDTKLTATRPYAHLFRSM